MRNVILAATLAMPTSLTARAAPSRAFPRYEGLDTNVYLTVTPRPKRERYETACYAIERAALIANGAANDPRVLPFFVEDIQTIALTPRCGVWSKVYIWVPLSWAVLPPPNNKAEVHVSLKFTGPTYVPGSTDQDEVRLDRIVVASPPSSKDAK
ncbi:hypothetical protein H8D79_00405 [PVC group bacterium]|nr:hypothetical protein [PVC group bacterium]